MRSDDRTDVPISRNGELLAEHLRRCEEHKYNGGMRHAEAGDECRRAALKPLLGRHDPAGGRSASSLPIYRRSLIAAANRPLSGASPPRSAVGTSWPATSRPPVPRASGPRCGHPPHHRRCRPGQEPSRRTTWSPPCGSCVRPRTQVTATRVLLALGFAGAFRRSELCALEVSDHSEVPDRPALRNPPIQDRPGRAGD
jgi:hypothetical protein